MKFVPSAVTRQIAQRAFEFEKNSPTFLFGAGIAGVMTSTVLACRATLKVQEVLEDAENELNAIKSVVENPHYTGEKKLKRAQTRIYTQATGRVVKLYSPAIFVGGASIAALTSSHNALNKRNAALTAAYAALDKGFKEYRERVVEKYGEDDDREFRYGSQEVEIIDEKTGKSRTVTRVPDDVPSIYARFFDPMSTSWSKEPEYNLLFLRCQQNYANDLLRARGHVFLNEVYDMIGIPRSKAGSVVGWIISRDNRTDNHIDFGIFVDEHNVRDFVNGREGSILLDFNVDGVIYDKIDVSTEEISWQTSR